MTPSELKYQHETKQGGYFFTRSTMKFFGDTMKNFGVRDGGEYWILYTKRPTKAGYREYYFDKVDYKRILNPPPVVLS